MSFAQTDENKDIIKISDIELTRITNRARQDEIANLTRYENENALGSLALQGSPLAYPFDKYHFELIYAFSSKEASFLFSEQDSFDYDDSVLSSWNRPNPIVSELDTDKAIHKNFETYCETHSFLDENVPDICNGGTKEKDTANIRNSSFLYVKIPFDRNFTIYAIITPLIAIFYLLGAIFIFENSSDHISHRLTLTLGIFALIFTLPEIINSMKPQTTGPTIADSLLSIIIISTIGFTVSSVISSSSVIQQKFRRHYKWIDGIVFLLVSGIVIALLHNYDLNIILWLIPLILFGLGYGLLLKMSGIKIIRVLKSILITTRGNNRNVKRSPL